MMKKLLVTAMIFSLVSCNKFEIKNVVKQPKEKTAIQVNETIIAPESFAGINSFVDLPEEIDGAACMFSVDKADYEKEKYIYVDDLDSICYIKMDGKFIRLELVEDNTPETSVDPYSKKFKNDDYQLSIEMTRADEDDEIPFLEGYMLIKYKDEPEERKDLYGICGC